MNVEPKQNDSQLSASEAEHYLRSIENDVESFESEEKGRLGVAADDKEQWRDLNPTEFTAEQRAHTTILHAGLTMAHDFFIQSAFRGLGYKVQAMEVPDNRSLQFGREYGNRGQCNPTYFTVGNLVKKLKAMEASGISKEDIVGKYLFATAGSCGPCRFGTYVTEYRKALRDAGFDGFRVILFQQSGGMKQATGKEMGMKFDAKFFLTISKAIILGDVLNALMYRIRPYELEAGATDAVIAQSKERIAKAFETRKGMLKALWQTRRAIAAIKVDKTQVKPRVAIIGEFWAMTTEGDGNYKMQRFLEQEGAEVDIQLVLNWGLYLLWGARFDTKERAKLKGVDKKLASDMKGEGSKFALEGVSVAKKMWMLKGGEMFLRSTFYIYSKLLGLRDYHLPDMDHIADISHHFYDNNLRGGEGHMEVGKLIHNVVDQKASMTLSIKPFGCMPSSAVSDGVQSLITELYPSSIFLPIETNGDGAVNVYSRVQMQLFKAKQSAEKEVQAVLDEKGWSVETFKAKYRESRSINNASYRSPHVGGCSTVDMLHDLVQKDTPLYSRLTRRLLSLMTFTAESKKDKTISDVKRAAQRVKAEEDYSADLSAVKIVEPS